MWARHPEMVPQMAECLIIIIIIIVIIIIICEFVCGYCAVCSGEFGHLEEV
jgi:hypothetical protein